MEDDDVKTGVMPGGEEPALDEDGMPVKPKVEDSDKEMPEKPEEDEQ